LNACLGIVYGVRYSLALSKDFSAKRFAFGRQLDKTPLHITTLVNIEMVHRAGMQIIFYAAGLLGRSECHDPNTQTYKDDYAVLRFITPIAKAYICKIGVQACNEAMEFLGGQGYMEESGMGRCVRDVQVNTIWEGTTNIL
jgi:alkylation response protein AidB-like acyl-CoA dehydrogenase